MKTSQNCLPCDGCGLPASPEHIRERVRRLELSTRFRPVLISVLFVALAPPAGKEDDFYGPAKLKEFFDPFLEALEIPASAQKLAAQADAHTADLARLEEFQRRGYYLTYLSECPIGESGETAAMTIARLGQTLIRRIRFSYRPKYVAPLGQELVPMVEMLIVAGIGPVLTQEQGQVLPIPSTGSREWMDLFRGSLTAVAP